MKSPTAQITKCIDAPWTDDTRQKLISFWSERRFRFADTSATSLVAQRGHILWNLISYDMTRLRAELRIRSPQSGRIELLMTVHTTFQQITEWNRAVLELEMTTCESFLLRDDMREAEWAEFMKAHRKAAWVWTFTGSLAGRRIKRKTNE